MSWCDETRMQLNSIVDIWAQILKQQPDILQNQHQDHKENNLK